MSENLWPDDFGTLTETPPVTILREQGNALGKMTSNILVGRVETGRAGEENRIRHVLFIYCPPLSFRVELLNVEHGIDLYPAEISYDDGKKKKTVNDSEQFMTSLKEIFGLPETKKLIASLIAQARE